MAAGLPYVIEVSVYDSARPSLVFSDKVTIIVTPTELFSSITGGSVGT